MKKYLLLIISLFVFMPSLVFASSIKVSNSSVKITKGQSVTVNITADNINGKIKINSANASIASVGTTSAWIDKSTGSSVTIKGNAVGKTTVTLASDTSNPSSIPCDDSGENDVIVRTIINVEVVEPQTQAPPTTTRAPQVTTTRPATTTVVPTTAPPVDLVFTSLVVEGFEVKVENGTYYVTVDKETTEVNIIASVPEGVTLEGTQGKRGLNDGKNTINYLLRDPATNRSQAYSLVITKPTADAIDTKLSSLKIVDHAIDFNPDVLEYTITVNPGTKELYIIAEPGNVNVSIMGTGLINLDSAGDTIYITATYGENNATKYVIHVKKSKTMIFMWIGIALSLLIAIGVIVYFNLKDQGKIKNNITSLIKTKAQANRKARGVNPNSGVKVGGNSVVGVGAGIVTPTQVSTTDNNPSTPDITDPTDVLNKEPSVKTTVVQPQVVKTVTPVKQVQFVQTVQPVKTIQTGNGQPQVKVVTKTVVQPQGEIENITQPDGPVDIG